MSEEKKDFKDNLASVIPAPQWLVKRNEELRKLPPPTEEDLALLQGVPVLASRATVQSS